MAKASVREADKYNLEMSLTAEEANLEGRLVRPNPLFLPQLDLLRSLAVIMVVADHTGFAFNNPAYGYGGLAGVWMFFVHTSLVLMWSLERKPYVMDFYVRRIFRVLPLAIIATLVVFFLRLPLSVGMIPYFGYKHVAPFNLLANLTLTQNLFADQPTIFSILHVEWTLPWEMDMYLVLPVLFAFARRQRSVWAMIFVWLLLVRFLQLNHIEVLSFPGSVPHFLAGVIAYVMYRITRPRLPSWLFPLFLATLIAAVLHVVQSRAQASWLFTLALACGLPWFRSFPKSVFTDVFHYIARYSYGIYLMHPIGILIGVRYLRFLPPYAQLAVVIILTAALSVAVYHALEKPMIDLGSRVAARMEIRALRKNPETSRHADV